MTRGGFLGGTIWLWYDIYYHCHVSKYQLTVSCMMKYRVGTRQRDARPCFRKCVATQMQRLLAPGLEQDGLRRQSWAIHKHWHMGVWPKLIGMALGMLRLRRHPTKPVDWMLILIDLCSDPIFPQVIFCQFHEIPLIKNRSLLGKGLSKPSDQNRLNCHKIFAHSCATICYALSMESENQSRHYVTPQCPRCFGDFP